MKKQKEELAEKLHKAQQDLKEKFQAKMMNSEEKKVLIAVNNYYVNSPQTYASTTPIVNPPVNVKEFSTPKAKSRYGYAAPNNNEDSSSRLKENKLLSIKFSIIGKTHKCHRI